MEDKKTDIQRKQHQAVLLSMLKDLDRVCRKHHIHYMLFSGTALGAVRHGGFIPWDDDLDIVLLRGEYERLLDSAEKELDSDKYYVQREFGPHWPMMFSKLRLNNTTCIEKYHAKDERMHQGVYIDIFPCDNLSDHACIRKMQFLASKIVIAKALYARGYATDSLVKKGFMQLCRLVPGKWLWEFCVRKEDCGSEMVHTFFGGGSKYNKNVFPRKWFEETIEMTFEDGSFPVPEHYDELLKKLYGDYMELPPPSQRKCKEHVAILDMKHNYTQYLEQQNTMHIDSYTRSIR